MVDGALQDQVAFITGCGSGLGASFARRLAAEGATVIVNDINAEMATAVAVEVGGEAAVFDVCDSAAFDAEVDKAFERHGRLDIMVNNAGIAPAFTEARFEAGMANQLLRMEGRIAEMPPSGYLTEMTDDEWDRMIRVHLYGAFFGTRAALRHMQIARRGAIVNISSVLGLQPSAGTAHYAAAKAAVIALTRSTAQEVAHLGIRVNAVCPGFIDTPLLAQYNDLMRAGITMRIPAGRMGSAQEIAEVVRFLVGPESSYCNGDVFSATGGFVS
jgi:3-oxoacyl-[acyl-carrier protein] reductase